MDCLCPCLCLSLSINFPFLLPLEMCLAGTPLHTPHLGGGGAHVGLRLQEARDEVLGLLGHARHLVHGGDSA